MSINHMDTLSEELLLRTLHYLHNSSTAKEFIAVLLVCQRFNRIGASILYKNVFICNRSLVTKIAPLRAHSYDVRSLSIRIQPCEPEMYMPDEANTYPRPVDPEINVDTKSGPETRALWEALDVFTLNVLPRLQNLSTFSMIVEEWKEGAIPIGWWIRHSSSARVLRSLPQSVENLELDLEMHDKPLTWAHPFVHNCPCLRRLLPGLRHLRLRLTTLCPALFYDLGEDDDSLHVEYNDDKAVKAPHLETLVVNATDGRHVMYPCGERDPYKRRNNGTRIPIMDLSWWTAICVRALHTGSFPNLSRFDVFDFEVYEYDSDEEEDDEYDEDALSQSALTSDHHIQYDILAGKTYYLPQRYVGGAPLMLRTRTHEEVFGGSYALGKKAEGPAWVETVEGVRFPASFAAKKREEEGYVWRKLDLLSTREDFSREHHYGLSVWDEEEKVGHWIMDVEEEDGV